MSILKTWKFRLIAVILAIMSLTPIPAKAQLTEGQAAIVGAIIGYSVGRNSQPPVVVYQVPPPVVIHPSQVQGYNPTDHGYCAPYTNEMYYQCLGNLQRMRNEDAYRRGLRGY